MKELEQSRKEQEKMAAELEAYRQKESVTSKRAKRKSESGIFNKRVHYDLIRGIAKRQLSRVEKLRQEREERAKKTAASRKKTDSQESDQSDDKTRPNTVPTGQELSHEKVGNLFQRFVDQFNEEFSDEMETILAATTRRRRSHADTHADPADDADDDCFIAETQEA